MLYFPLEVSVATSLLNALNAKFPVDVMYLMAVLTGAKEKDETTHFTANKHAKQRKKSLVPQKSD